jgi:hypothetical protein
MKKLMAHERAKEREKVKEKLMMVVENFHLHNMPLMKVGNTHTHTREWCEERGKKIKEIFHVI